MKTKKKKGKDRSSNDYVLSKVVRVYELAKAGLGDSDIAATLPMSAVTFRKFKKIPAIADAIQRARTPMDNGRKRFADYLYDQLPDNLKEVWTAIESCANGKTTRAKVEAMLTDKGKLARQHLFLYAFVNSNFNPSEACRKVGVTKPTFDAWVLDDPEFGQLIEEIHWHKENFFEAAFIGKVADGDTPCILHAVKSKLAHRGYGKQASSKNVNVNVNGKVSHVHTAVPIHELNLPLDARKQLLVALREHKGNESEEEKE